MASVWRVIPTGRLSASSLYQSQAFSYVDEVGDDFFGQQPIVGNASFTFGAMTTVSDTDVFVVGSGLATFGALTTVSDSDVFVVANSSISFEAMTISSSTVSIIADANLTFGASTLSSTAALPISGVSSPTFGAMIVSADGDLSIVVSGIQTLGAMTTGSVGVVSLTGGATISFGAMTVEAETIPEGTMGIAAFVSNYSGALDDKIHNFLLDNTTGTNSSWTNNDLWMKFLTEQGQTSGTLKDRMRQFLLAYNSVADTGQTVEDLWSLVTGPYSAGTLLLDLYGAGAEAAYSTRKLREAATFAMRVVETGGSTQQDIGFTGEDLNSAALDAFVGVNDGRVRIWYDQSTGGEDMDQGTASLRPFAATAGTVETAPNGKPTVRAAATSSMTIPNGATNSVKSAFFVFKTDDTAAAFTWYLALNSGGTIGAIAGGDSNTGPGYINGSTVQAASENTSTHILSVVLSGTTATVHLDNVSLGTIGSLSDLGPLQFVMESFVGKLCEVVLFSTDKTANRAAITTNMATYWGVTI